MVDKGVDNGSASKNNPIYEQVFAIKHVFVYTVIKTNECLKISTSQFRHRQAVQICDILEYLLYVRLRIIG